MHRSLHRGVDLQALQEELRITGSAAGVNHQQRTVNLPDRGPRLIRDRAFIHHVVATEQFLNCAVSPTVSVSAQPEKKLPVSLRKSPV